MNWSQVVAGATVFLVVAAGILIAILEGRGDISGDWASTLWGFLLGSGVTGGAWALKSRQPSS